ncbi:hypothetical protein BBP40_012713 [Aspergillus hancockii]|nr:hypothetical protein BBP40_012713 [Aspergillus hancockii]
MCRKYQAQADDTDCLAAQGKTISCAASVGCRLRPTMRNVNQLFATAPLFAL